MNVNSIYAADASIYTDGYKKQINTRKDEEFSKKVESVEKWSGDMTITLHEKMNGLEYDDSLDGKSKQDMTLDEYKQWYRNQVAQMPVSGYVANSYVSTQLIIKDECFERMKNDPQWKETILNMTRDVFGVNGLIGSKSIGFQVLGATPAECYGESIPVDNTSEILTSNKKESWWQKRHDVYEELLEDMIKKAQLKEKEKREEMQEEYWKNHFERLSRNNHFFPQVDSD